MAGSSTVDHRSHVRPERDRNLRYRPARLPGHQIRRLVVAVHGVTADAVCAAQVRRGIHLAPDIPSGDGWWTYVRAQLGDRLQHQLARASRRWRHQTGGHLCGDRFL
jgi:hypothetical protein